MSADAIAKNDLAIAPLGAGDLIDRAVRFYRRNFWTLAAIAAPPVVVGTAVSVAWTLAARSLFGVTSAPGGDFERLTYYLFVWLGNLRGHGGPDLVGGRSAARVLGEVAALAGV